MRAVLDAGVFISALISPEGTPRAVFAAWLDGHFELVISPRLMAELATVLSRRKFDVHITSEDRDLMLGVLATAAEMVRDVDHPEASTRDPGDDYLIALARAARVDVLVSGDRDLVEADVPGVSIVTPRGFATMLGL